MAKDFLTTACPELLTILESHYDEKSANDRLVKIGRNINATLRYGQEALARKERGEQAMFDIWSTDEEDEHIGNELNRKMKSDAR